MSYKLRYKLPDFGPFETNPVSQSLKDLFFAACLIGNTEKIRACLTLEMDINYPNKDDQTGLMVCSYHKQNSALEMLLQDPRLDVNKVDKHGYTAVHYACSNNNSTAVINLCQKPGVLVNTVDKFGDTALLVAVKCNNFSCVEAFGKEAGLDWNTRDSAENTAIMVALKACKTDMVKFMMKLPEVDLNRTDKENKTLENIAREMNMKDILKLLPGTNEFQLEALTRDMRIMQGGMNKTAPECPVCYNHCNPKTQIFQCAHGHIVCGACRPDIKDCPTCRGAITGRAHAFEQFIENTCLTKENTPMYPSLPSTAASGKPLSNEYVGELSQMFPGIEYSVIQAVFEGSNRDKVTTLNALLQIGSS